MKISVIGVGAQGMPTALMLTRSPEVSEVVIADIDMERVKRVADRLKSEKVSMRCVDASSIDDLIEVTKGSRCVVNAAHPRYTLQIMDAALKNGANYVDYATDNVDSPLEEALLEKLKLNDRWINAGLTAVINQGGPLALNALVRYAADRLDSVEEIKLRMSKKRFTKVEETVPTWAPQYASEVALIEWVTKPVVYENGKYKRCPPFSGMEEYVFPDPVGPQKVCFVEYEPALTLPRYIHKGLRYMDVKISPDILAGVLINMGFASDTPIDVKGVKVAPCDVLYALTRTAAETTDQLESRLETDKAFDQVRCDLIEVKGEKAGVKTHYCLYRVTSCREMYEKYGAATVHVAIPGAVTAVMLGKGEIKTKGVIPPECLEPEPYLARLVAVGWLYQERITREIRTV